MTEADIFAGICVLAFAGWTWAIIGYTRASLAAANAVSVLQKVDSLMDERLLKLLDRIDARRAKPMTPPQPRGSSEPPQRNAAQEELNRIFGGSTLIEEQPEADGLEIVHA